MSSPQELAASPVNYRCVCGESIALSPTAGGTCPSCGRRYAASVLRLGGGETQTIDVSPGSTPLDRAPASAEHDSLIGKTFGHYRIVSRLGQGGMGAVYRALDESLQRYVALKVIWRANPSVADSRHIQRLLQEAIAQARVNHPHVVHIYFVGHEGDSPFFAMELVNGITLAQRLATGTIPFEEIIQIAEQISDALGHAVSYDIVHGDIKPSNVLLAEGLGVKISDFGLARRLSQLSNDGGIAGTPNYIAPEVVQGAPPDVRSDLYSLGVTLFEMTFGRLPYSVTGASLVEWFRAHREAPVEFPDPWPETVPTAWRDVLAKLLAKSPSDRYPSYDELLAALRRLRPGAAPSANRLLRFLAWAADSALVGVGQIFLYGVLLIGQATDYLDKHLFGQLALAVAGAAVPAFVALAQARFKTTPGKEMFQIRIVDRHGLVPSTERLALRSVAQFLPFWYLAAVQLTRTLPLGELLHLLVGTLVNWMGFGVVLLVFVDGLCVLIRREGRSLHDQLLGTRVVLNTASEESKS